MSEAFDMNRLVIPSLSAVAAGIDKKGGLRSYSLSLIISRLLTVSYLCNTVFD